jgi:hypothetical protein
MTDKKMAKEYVDTLLNKDDAEFDKFLDENLGDLKLTKKQAGALLGIIKGIGISSFLAGLEAGRPKWHKVADGDLPKEECGWVCNQDGLPCYFDWGTEQWLDCEGTQIRTTEWSNMPHKE